MDTVPKSLAPELLAFCREISANRPRFIVSRPSTDAVVNACFDNVARKIARAGGNRVFGWAIWHIANLYFEAEHHGVWQNKMGEIRDVSPQHNGAKRILFLPDENAIYDPKKQRQNIVKPASSNEESVEFCYMINKKNSIIQKYRTDEYVKYEMTIADTIEISKLDRKIREIISSGKY